MISTNKLLPFSALHFAALVVFPAKSAWAMPEICGNGIDDDGAGGDLPCPDPDKDKDGYNSAASGGTDCDDNDYKIYAGVTTGSGCPAGQTRTCQSNGVYTACSTTPICEAASGGTCKYIDCGSGSDSANGSFSTPWKSFKMVGSYYSGSKPAGWYALHAGDVIYLKGSGACADWYAPGGTTPNSQISLFSVNGTASAPITIKRYPGSMAVFDPPFTKTLPGNIFHLESSSYIKLEDLELTGSYAPTIYIEGGQGVEIARIKCHDSQGTTLNNLACVNAAGASNLYIHHSEMFNFNDPDTPMGENVYLIVMFHGSNNRVEYNRLYYTASPASGTTVRGRCFRYKHPSDGGTITIRGNQFWNCMGGAVENSATGMRMDHNLFVNSPDYNGATGYNCDDLGGGTAYCSDAIIEYNTFVNARAFQLQQDGVNANLGTNIYRHNVAVDNANSYTSENGFIRIARYGSDAQYASFMALHGLLPSGNCYYNPRTAIMFDLFADDPPTTGAYLNFTGWKALGFDLDSSNADPGLDQYFRATSGACSGAGWTVGGGGGSSRPAAPTGLSAEIAP